MTTRPWLIAIAPDSFKGTLTADAAATAIARGLQAAWPRTRCRLIPMADGGEGFSVAVVAAMNGRWLRARVQDPLGRPVAARWGWVARDRLAVIEMAVASGLPLLTAQERNPLVTSTHGTGELIRRALDRGAQRILLGIGGSATNDGGTGMARALGWRFLDSRGRDLPSGGGALRRLDRIDGCGADPRVRDVAIDVACDVTNPLCGTHGASVVYGPQKGATVAGVRQLDAGLARLADVVQNQLGLDVAGVPGAGAAGGLGFGLMAFCGGQLRRGVDSVAAAVDLEQRMRGCDLVITGEGRIDGQTVNGKTPVGVAAVAQRLGVPVIAICGSLGAGFEAVHGAGIAAVFSAGGSPADPDFVSGAAGRLSRCAGEVGRLLALAVPGSRMRAADRASGTGEA